MKVHVAADDRQRVIHSLVREVGDRPEGMGHVCIEDLAALVSGTLFKTECSRVENHLLSCPACAQLSSRLHDEFEAGVVPILLRRATSPGTSHLSLSAKITRRWSPWLLGTMAAAVVLFVSVSSYFDFGNNDRLALRDCLVVSRVGAPFLEAKTAGENHQPIEPGTWLTQGTAIEVGAGDWLEVMDRHGEFWVVTPHEESSLSPATPFSQELAKRAWDERNFMHLPERKTVAAVAPKQDDINIVHPRGAIFGRRPQIRWSSERPTRKVSRGVFEKGKQKALFRQVGKGRKLSWPADVLSLEPGRQYWVKVFQLEGDKEILAEISFNVIDGPQRVKVEQGLFALETMVGRSPNILRAEFLRQMNLYAECREELERLRITETENVALLLRLRDAFRQLGLQRETIWISRLIGKRR